MRIDPELAALIPPLADEERAQLEANIITEGCRDALVTWRGTLLDGHNRYEICTRLGIEYRAIEAAGVTTRTQAMDWIDANQLGRRNLTPDAFKLLLGRRYNRAKKQGARTDLTSDQIDPKLHTADRLAAEHGVSAATVKRAGMFAAQGDPGSTRRPRACSRCSRLFPLHRERSKPAPSLACSRCSRSNSSTRT